MFSAAQAVGMKGEVWKRKYLHLFMYYSPVAMNCNFFIIIDFQNIFFINPVQQASKVCILFHARKSHNASFIRRVSCSYATLHLSVSESQ